MSNRKYNASYIIGTGSVSIYNELYLEFEIDIDSCKWIGSNIFTNISSKWLDHSIYRDISNQRVVNNLDTDISSPWYIENTSQTQALILKYLTVPLKTTNTTAFQQCRWK